MSKLILGFHSAKGGVGRTTTMCLTAFQLIKQGFNVLCVDTDFEAPSLDVILRTMPEREQKSKDGIESILNGIRRPSEAKGMVVDVFETWREPAYREWIDNEVYEVDHTATQGLDDLLQKSGLDSADIGKLWCLPCARGPQALNVNYENIVSNNSTKNLFNRTIDTLQQKFEYDIVLVDMRNGMSDAAAIIGQSVGAIVHVSQNKLAHSVMMAEAINWYTTLQWGIPPFTCYSQDMFVEDSTSDDIVIDTDAKTKHEAPLKAMLGGAFSGQQRRMFTGFGGPKLGSMPISKRLFISDFALRGFVECQKYTASFTERLHEYANLQAKHSDMWANLSKKFEKLS